MRDRGEGEDGGLGGGDAARSSRGHAFTNQDESGSFAGRLRLGEGTFVEATSRWRTSSGVTDAVLDGVSIVMCGRTRAVDAIDNARKRVACTSPSGHRQHESTRIVGKSGDGAQVERLNGGIQGMVRITSSGSCAEAHVHANREPP